MQLVQPYFGCHTLTICLFVGWLVVEYFLGALSVLVTGVKPGGSAKLIHAKACTTTILLGLFSCPVLLKVPAKLAGQWVLHINVDQPGSGADLADQVLGCFDQLKHLRTYEPGLRGDGHDREHQTVYLSLNAGWDCNGCSAILRQSARQLLCFFFFLVGGGFYHPSLSCLCD